MNISLITSGKYISNELIDEYGEIPPSTLPIGHETLLEHQIKLIDENDLIFISLPASYQLETHLKNIIEANGIKIILSTEGENLRDLLLNFLSSSFFNLSTISKISILHGDTLFSELPFNPDTVCINRTDIHHTWLPASELNSDIDDKYVLSGYFSFSNIQLLKKLLAKSNSFEEGLIEYNNLKTLNIEIGKKWIDYGNSNNYYFSKRSNFIAREFNTHKISGNFITKKSTQIKKISREYNWFKSIPDKIKLYTPHVWNLQVNQNSSSYNIEFVPGSSLQEKLIFGRLNFTQQERIIVQIIDLINSFKSMYNDSNTIAQKNQIFYELYIKKTEDRMTQIEGSLNLENKINFRKPLVINDVEYPSFRETKLNLLDKLNSIIKNRTDKPSFMHGDLCFSNIIYDVRSMQVKLIDPRGIENENERLGGDYLYDLIKFGHSCIGFYDLIICNRYSLFDLGNNSLKMKIHLNKSSKNYSTLFLNHYCKVSSLEMNDLKILISSLFFSMIPLHREDDQRQLAFILNAYRLFYNFKL